jgi:hypothetical protein
MKIGRVNIGASPAVSTCEVTATMTKLRLLSAVGGG